MSNTQKLDDIRRRIRRLLIEEYSSSGENSRRGSGHGTAWPTNAAFIPKPQEDGLSVYRRMKLEAAGLGASAVATRPEHIVFGMETGDVRAVKRGARDDAWPPGIPDEEHQSNGAHALIVGWEGMTRGEIKRRARELAKLPLLKLVS